MIISSDCHAGLPNEEYRPYLDPQFRDAFDAHLAEREAMREQFQIMGNKHSRRSGSPRTKRASRAAGTRRVATRSSTPTAWSAK